MIVAIDRLSAFGKEFMRGKKDRGLRWTKEENYGKTITRDEEWVQLEITWIIGYLETLNS